MLGRIREAIARALPFFLRKRIPEEIFKHLYFNGKFEARLNGRKIATLNSTGNQIENEIYWKGFEGSLEGLSSQVWASIVAQTKPSEIWDIGASSGTYGILAKSIFPDCRVSFFEPIPKAVRMIEQNLILNSFNANLFELALGDYDGEGQIYFSEGVDFAYSVTVNRDTTMVNARSTEMKIRVSRAESILEIYNCPPPNLIKLDVETFEPEVLKGFGSRFPHDSVFLIEVLTETNAERLSEFFPENKYDFYKIDDVNKVMKKTLKLEKSDFYNCLVIPKRRSSEFNFDHINLWENEVGQ